MPRSAPPDDATDHDDLVQTAVVVYALLQRLRPLLSAVETGPDANDVELGMLMGLSMYLDDRIGPFRTQRLMVAAPGIVLKTDAHVVPEQIARLRPLLRRFAHDLALSLDRPAGS